MSAFPTKILLATDGSEDSALAAQAAIGNANETGAELHVVHVGETRPLYPPPASGPRRTRLRAPRFARRPKACSTTRQKR